MKNVKFTTTALSLLVLGAVAFTSCKKDKDPMTKSMDYAFNTGQVGAGTAYSGSHASSFSAKVMLTEEDGDKTKVTVTLYNTLSGQDYNLHVHDKADAATTPNGTPYNETPNASILAMTIAGNGGTATKDFSATVSYNYILNTYAGGFFVVHDPTQTLSTTNLTTYLVVGAFPN